MLLQVSVFVALCNAPNICIYVLFVCQCIHVVRVSAVLVCRVVVFSFIRFRSPISILSADFQADCVNVPATKNCVRLLLTLIAFN